MTVDQRSVAAGRIAWATLLGGRHAVDTNDVAPCAVGAARIGDFAGGSETVRATPFAIGTLDVREVIQSGLFTRTGSQFRWIHKSFAEFFAAYHLRDTTSSLPQIMKLLGAAGQKTSALARDPARPAAIRWDV